MSAMSVSRPRPFAVAAPAPCPLLALLPRALAGDPLFLPFGAAFSGRAFSATTTFRTTPWIGVAGATLC